MTGSDDVRGSRYASPPCFLAEVEDASLAEDRLPDNVPRWRKAERARLIADRMATDPAIRSLYGRQIAERLNHLLRGVSGHTVSGYWPYKGEPDLRPWLAALPQRKGRAALPVIVAKGEALRFRHWRAGDPLERGIWNIPFPTEGADVAPDIVIVPLVGFDRAGYRLGYGGGYFDRTLAAATRRPRIIGVGFAQSELPTIHPQPHDIPMDVIITEDEIAEFKR